MALIPKSKVVPPEDCKSILIYDNIGVYDATSNPGGFNSPNPVIGSVLTRTITITFPDGTTIAPISVYPTLPNLNDIPFLILNTDMGLPATQSIPEGAWYFVDTITGNNGSPYTATNSYFKYLACSVCCCVKKAAGRASGKGCKCTKADKIAFSEVWDDYELMMDAAACGKFNQANEILAQLQLTCKKLNCGCS